MFANLLDMPQDYDMYARDFEDSVVNDSPGVARGSVPITPLMENADETNGNDLNEKKE